jgi:hypothetical protein
VPARGRSAFVQRLLEQALAPEGGGDYRLYLVAMEVEADERLSTEMTEWDATVADGLAGETVTVKRGRAELTMADLRAVEDGVRDKGAASESRRDMGLS